MKRIWITLAYVDGVDGIQQVNVYNTAEEAEAESDWSVILGNVDTIEFELHDGSEYCLACTDSERYDDHIHESYWQEVPE